jgi:5-methylcytosine-specific restriction endonuclease McrA
MVVTEGLKNKIWKKASTVTGKNPTHYRKDAYGNLMFYRNYGQSTPMGWEIDHIKPQARGGSDAIVNLQALNTSVNRSKGDSLKKKSRHSKTNK